MCNEVRMLLQQASLIVCRDMQQRACILLLLVLRYCRFIRESVSGKIVKGKSIGNKKAFHPVFASLWKFEISGFLHID